MFPEEFTRLTFHHLTGLGLLCIPLIAVWYETRGLHRLRCAYLILIVGTLDFYIRWAALTPFAEPSYVQEQPIKILWFGVLPLLLSGVSFREAVGTQFQAAVRLRRVAWLGIVWCAVLLYAVLVDALRADLSTEGVMTHWQAVGVGSIFVPLIVGVVLEEFFYRGILWAILPESWSVWYRILMTTCAFAGIHAIGGMSSAGMVVGMGLFGTVFGLLRAHYGLWAAIVVHLVNNASVAALDWI